MLLRRNFKYRLYPTPAQDALLRRWEGVLRFLWNLCNEQRLAGYGRPRDERVFVTHYDQSKQMTELLDGRAVDRRRAVCQARQEMLADSRQGVVARCFKKLACRAPHWKRRGDAMRIFAPTATVKHHR